jgi:NAD(P)-dependent dehydrogenase (short-subunit alcohol dehydrogenase family)
LLEADFEVVVLDSGSLALGSRDAGVARLHAVRGDVTISEDVLQAVELATGLGRLRAVVNCAGISRPGRTVKRNGDVLDLETFRRTVDVNLTGTFNVVRFGAAAMMRQQANVDGERGVVVMTSSTAAFDGPSGHVPYVASKAAVAGMTLSLARDLAPLGIRVVTIAPGAFETPMYRPPEHVLAGAPELRRVAERVHERLEPQIAFPPRPGDPHEYAALVLHILHNHYLNGEVVRLDAGLRWSETFRA